ncbi:hypothetical protein KTT56_06910 [Pseudomonas viridiflava]|uniref:hypothetical protein n=1 Tax=Pseudomonas viridiflava TaxID=33069 RepID=UPI001C31AF99|nr:hypothetical protein [Pseudomonas viridiflava]QXG26569.1 hypothetical protein KTT56_06910 [Pseudomonas viridiflava]
MFNKSSASSAQSDNPGTKKRYERKFENGCKANVCAHELPDGDIELVVDVCDRNGRSVAKRTTRLPGAEWTVPDAMKRGRDQAERIAGGESGRLPCADRADREEDDDDD